jgi:hypothetical protein
VLIAFCILLTGIGTYLSLHDGKKKSAREILWKIITVLLLVAPGYFLSIYDKILSNDKEKYESDSFTIDTSKTINSKMACIDLVGARIFSGNGDYTFFKLLDPLNVEIVNSTMRLSFTIRDINDNVLCEIKNNTVSVNHEFVMDKNFDKNGFEIINHKGEVAFQAQLMDSCVRVNFITGVGQKRLKLFGYGLIIPIENNYLPFKIEKLFKYPSQIYPGQREIVNKDIWNRNLKEAEMENNEIYQIACLNNLFSIDSSDYEIKKKYYCHRLYDNGDAIAKISCYSFLQENQKDIDLNFAFAKHYFYNRIDSSVYYLNKCLKIDDTYRNGLIYFYFALLTSKTNNKKVFYQFLELAFERGFKIELSDDRIYAYDLFLIYKFIHDKEFSLLCNKYNSGMTDTLPYFLFLKDKGLN